MLTVIKFLEPHSVNVLASRSMILAREEDARLTRKKSLRQTLRYYCVSLAFLVSPSLSPLFFADSLFVCCFLLCPFELS